ncbi:M20 family metallopeptidase [Paucisalibacillus sp. EB02]|uniref:M20 family metallopeptidase n=1 Tax=Paucisalibacillus sp. EB02 TaxID=1347087 RepID=UPI0005A66ABF
MGVSTVHHTIEIDEIIERKRDLYINISEKIWNFAEMSYEEKESAELLCKSLEEQGFEVERGVAGIDTAFIGSYGSGGPVVAILGEFDALAGLSQEKGVAEYRPLSKNGSGHGCGHNLLGTGAFAAAVAVKEYMQENGLSGTVRYYGCPAEESGDGKTYMVREGLFDDVDFALTWHPMSVNAVSYMNALATYQVYFRFKGRASHAATSPHLGRSALDAVELMNVGVNYLREHIIDDARIHYAITNTGGFSPNVVQAEAEVLYLIRAPKVGEVENIYQRVHKIAQGAALMTETELEIEFDSGTSDLIRNTTLDKVMLENFQKLGVPEFTEGEINFAEKIQATLTEEELADLWDDSLRGKALTDVILPLQGEEKAFGSTDVADVSWVTPTAQVHTTCIANGTSLHTWQVVSQVGTSIGHKGMLHAGKVIAATAVEMMQNEDLIQQAKKDLQAKLGGKRYVSPIPSDVVPPINRKN